MTCLIREDAVKIAVIDSTIRYQGCYQQIRNMIWRILLEWIINLLIEKRFQDKLREFQHKKKECKVFLQKEKQDKSKIIMKKIKINRGTV